MTTLVPSLLIFKAHSLFFMVNDDGERNKRFVIKHHFQDDLKSSAKRLEHFN